MKRVLVTNLIMQRDLGTFRAQLEAANIETVAHPIRQFLSEAELLPIIGRFDGVIAGDDQFTERVLQTGLPRLKVISKWGVGLDTIDLEAAERLGIRVYNSPGAFGDAVAEVAVGYMLMLSRSLHRVDRQVRQGGWPKVEGEGLKGKVLGLVGFGSIGRAIAGRALAFGMMIMATDVQMAAMEPLPGVEFATLESLLTQADHLCLACNLTPTNRGMINGAALGQMKPTAYLVNMARGPLVDQPALVEALKNRQIGGAALDVYETEPLPAGHPLTHFENVVLGSHNANNLRSANDYVNRNTIRNLLLGFGQLADEV